MVSGWVGMFSYVLSGIVPLLVLVCGVIPWPF